MEEKRKHIERILKQKFNCKEVFYPDGRITPEGNEAKINLVVFLQEFVDIGLIPARDYLSLLDLILKVKH